MYPWNNIYSSVLVWKWAVRRPEWRLLTAGIATLLLACGASAFAAPPPQSPETANPLAVVTVQTRVLGPAIPRDFVGYSVEVSTGGQGISASERVKSDGSPGGAAEQTVYGLGHPDAPNSGYFQFMKNLGPGILRLGGNSQDNVCWDSTHAPHPEGCDGALTAPDFALYSKAAAASGWKLIVGLNLKQNSATWALSEVTQGVSREIKPGQILGLEIGNEPDLFNHTPYRPKNYSATDHAKEFLSYADAFQSDPAAKAYPVMGPATGANFCNPRDLGTFIDLVGARRLKLVTIHNYSLTTCGNRTVTIEQLLSPDLMEHYSQKMQPLVAEAGKQGVPIALAETNTASCGGMPGVSNAFASAVWGLDYMFATARLGFTMIGFHSSYRSTGSYYNPVISYGSEDGSHQWHYHNVAQPIYYGMYLFALHASGSHLLTTSIQTSSNIRADAVTRCATCEVNVFVINKDLNASGPVHIHVEGRKGKASLLMLAAPSLSSRAEDVRLGGAQFDSHGHLPAPQTSSLQPDAQGDYTFTLPNASAAMVTVEARR